MEISTIFEIVKESLFSVQYKCENEHELKRIFNLWNDPLYLEEFFEAHKGDLENGFWGNITIESAILATRKEAQRLERKLVYIAEAGKNDRYETLSTLFKPLHDKTTRITAFEENKVKGDDRPSWLRIYAIRIDSNLFVISGGAIKLTRTMNERKHLLKELEKLEITREFLLDDENADLPIFELFL
jgi:hypothetical protein